MEAQEVSILDILKKKLFDDGKEGKRRVHIEISGKVLSEGFNSDKMKLSF